MSARNYEADDIVARLGPEKALQKAEDEERYQIESVVGSGLDRWRKIREAILAAHPELDREDDDIRF